MSRKQVAAAVLGIVVASVGSGVVAYHCGRSKESEPLSLIAPNGNSEAGCVDFHQAGLHTGENGCVSGRVLRVFTSHSGNTFLDFCQDYRQCQFTSVIFGSDRSRFGNLGALEGRRIEIVGQITTYAGRSEIVIHGPKQIREAN